MDRVGDGELINLVSFAVQGGKEERFRRDIFLVEEQAVFGGAGFIIDDHMLGDLAGGAGKVGEGVVTYEDQMSVREFRPEAIDFDVIS